jgi:ELWxxDGT repeat protein
LWRDFGSLTLGGSNSKGGDSSQSLVPSAAGSVLFADLMPGDKGSSPAFLSVFKDHMYFAADGVDTSWMVLPQHRDRCDSFRQSSLDERIHFAVSQHTEWLPTRTYDCPVGFHWASTDEGQQLFTSHLDTTLNRQWHSQHSAEIGQRHGPQRYTFVHQFEKSTSVENMASHEAKVYSQQCGWNSLEWGNQTRRHFRFSDSHVTGAYKHAAEPDSYRPDTDSLLNGQGLWTSDFAGIVCVAGPPLTSACNKDPAHCSQYSTVGHELWRTDGTVEGTERVEDLFGGSQGSHPAYMTPFGNYLYFAATSAVEGRELWRTSGGHGQAEMVTMPDTKSQQGIYPGAAR